jgi:ribosomal-protein-alanine N-acetyltransferase
MPEIRRGTAADLSSVAAIQAASPEASNWNVRDYLDHDFLVAIVGNSVAAFAIYRQLAPDERELLNIAVAPEFRRKGIARALWNRVITGFRGYVFLEVRASNSAAISLYKSLNFKEISIRQNYYQSPPEAAIVMKFHSC